MITRDMLEFVRQHNLAGTPKEEVIKMLKTGGWSRADVEQAYGALNPTPPPVRQAPAAVPAPAPVQQEQAPIAPQPVAQPIAEAAVTSAPQQSAPVLKTLQPMERLGSAPEPAAAMPEGPKLEAVQIVQVTPIPKEMQAHAQPLSATPVAQAPTTPQPAAFQSPTPAAATPQTTIVPTQPPHARGKWLAVTVALLVPVLLAVGALLLLPQGQTTLRALLQAGS